MYYKIVITLEVLSEAPVPEMELGDLAYQCDEGAYVGDIQWGEPEELTGKEMADALYAARSEPAFFMLDDEGHSELAGGESGDED